MVVGVSGGPDSTALLLLLNQIKEELKLKLYVAHFDHRLRRGSGKDREFVKGLSLKLGLPFISAVNRKHLEKGSVEELSRERRLAFFFKAAQSLKAKTIALGHNLDDQAETVLMRVLRGTGLSGLSAILPKRNIQGYRIIRPLIEVKRKDIRAFLRKKKVKACVDESNFKDIYFRNKIRNKLLPLIRKEYNKNINEVLANMAESTGYDYDYLFQRARSSLKGERTCLDVKLLLRMHPAMRRLAFRQAISALQGSMRRITFQHIKELEDLLLNRPENSIVDLPKGVSARVRKGRISFYFRTFFP